MLQSQTSRDQQPNTLHMEYKYIHICKRLNRSNLNPQFDKPNQRLIQINIQQIDRLTISKNSKTQNCQETPPNNVEPIC